MLPNRRLRPLVFPPIRLPSVYDGGDTGAAVQRST
jgi:hypothetical protein